MSVLVRRAYIAAAAMILIGIASPVHAAPGPADLSVDAVETMTIAEGASIKYFNVRIRNLGGTEIVGFKLKIDGTALPNVDIKGGSACEKSGKINRCSLENVHLLPQEKLVMTFFLIPTSSTVPGVAGSYLVEVSSSDTPSDPNLDNNDNEVKVMVKGGGADLIGDAQDVYERDTNDDRVGPIKPGDEATLNLFVQNFGTMTAERWSYTIVLPEHVSFVLPTPSICQHTADDKSQTEVCAPEQLLFLDGGGAEFTVARRVKVSANAPGPITVTGTFTVRVIRESAPPDTLASKAGAAPGVESNPSDEPLETVDPGDNTDHFAVFIGAASAGGGGGGLPVTGAKIGTVTGIGAAALAIGFVMVLIGHRRRTRLKSATHNNS